MVVLWVMVLLTVIASEFVFSMRTEMNITINFKEDAEAYYAALAGIEEAKSEILSIENEMKLDDNGLLIFDEKQPHREGSIGNAKYSYDIIDEDSKLNINTATPDQLRQILEYAEVEESLIDTIIDSIQDWRDPDDLHRINGAEEEYYLSLPQPHSCKDGPFDTIEELLLVKGITPVIFSGSFETPVTQGIEKYLTAKSSGAVNINTADRIILKAAFGEAMAESIILQRPFLVPAGGYIVKSSNFTVISIGISGRTKRVVKVILLKKPNGNIETAYWNDNLI
ncbi:MAG: general secretion pathway protein GspK [Proteobacteria bacterium]|nr:general secretion pathway protein GspK [Pseudomonadota bacterium]